MEWEPEMSAWGTLIEFFGAFCVWVGVPLVIYGQIAGPKVRESATLTKRKGEIVAATILLVLGVVAFEWGNQLSLELTSFL